MYLLKFRDLQLSVFESETHKSKPSGPVDGFLIEKTNTDEPEKTNTDEPAEPGRNLASETRTRELQVTPPAIRDTTREWKHQSIANHPGSTE